MTKIYLENIDNLEGTIFSRYKIVMQSDIDVTIDNPEPLRPLQNHFLNTISKGELKTILLEKILQSTIKILKHS